MFYPLAVLHADFAPSECLHLTARRINPRFCMGLYYGVRQPAAFHAPAADPRALTSLPSLSGVGVRSFVLGFIMLFWLWNIPMSHKQKMGIVAGVSCQLGWNIIRRQAWG